MSERGNRIIQSDYFLPVAKLDVYKRQACYREGRTGDRFMALCKSMQILNCCHPNALMTLKEYLEDYASPQTRELGMKLIDREIEKITNPKVKQTCYEHIHDIADGKRDFRF